MLAITSDYVQSLGDPQPYLERIARAGFTQLHWCHHWDDDFLYSDAEMDEIKKWLQEYGLSLLNLHSSHGREKYWVSEREYQRQAGIELVQNRIRMTSCLGANVTILHIPSTELKEIRPARMQLIRKSLEQLEPLARSHSVRLALENLPGDDYQMLEALFSEYDAGFIGLCFDSGHANLKGPGLEPLQRLKDRLIAIHLHDNDGTSDQHKIPFTGTVDWEALSGIIATSSYNDCVNLEVGIQRSGYPDEEEFLRQACQAGERLSKLIKSHSIASAQG